MPEQRHHPRIPASLRVELGGFEFSTTNISVTGLQVACPGMIFDLLSDELEAAELVVVLPDQKRVRGRCRLVYASEWNDEYLLGLEFANFEDNGHELLNTYIASSSETPLDAEDTSPGL